jgi:hypothetical protein
MIKSLSECCVLHAILHAANCNVCCVVSVLHCPYHNILQRVYEVVGLSTCQYLTAQAKFEQHNGMAWLRSLETIEHSADTTRKSAQLLQQYGMAVLAEGAQG